MSCKFPRAFRHPQTRQPATALFRLVLLLCLSPLAAAQEPSPPQQPQGLIRLDITVTSPSGQPVTSLVQSDFTLLDNGKPAAILSFAPPHPDERVTAVILLDTLDMDQQNAAAERAAVEEFLSGNGGHLPLPVAIYSLSDSDFSLTASASLDGNALAAAIRQNQTGRPLLYPRLIPGTATGTLDHDYLSAPPFTGLRALAILGATLRQMPGRKVLLWLGPGRGTGTGAVMLPEERWTQIFETRNRSGFRLTGPTAVFYMIEWFSLLLRDARTSLYTLSQQQRIDSGIAGLLGFSLKDFLNGVPSPEDAHPMDLYKDVLAVQSGGLALQAADLARQIAACIEDGIDSYTLTFNPPLAAHSDEYHTLQARTDKPDLAARTHTGYYDQPFYTDRPAPGTQDLTVAQLQQLVERLRKAPDREAAQQVSFVHLTERLSESQLDALSSRLRGKKSREALQIIAAPSAFLDPPPAATGSGPPPTPAAQQQILAAVVSYLNHIIPRLPDFFATRTSLAFSETPAYSAGLTRIEAVPLHLAEHFKGPVLYRRGAEIVAAAPISLEGNSSTMQAHGTFGPLLSTVRQALAIPNAMRWGYWEQSSGPSLAVFRFEVPPKYSTFLVAGCCLPEGSGNSSYAALPGYQGEIAVDPASGAIYRISVITDLRDFVPDDRGEMMVSYGPVTIGARTFILPLRSVNLSHIRLVESPSEWEQSFRTWGPYLTMITDFSFEDYHMFSGEAHILPGTSHAPDTALPKH